MAAAPKRRRATSTTEEQAMSKSEKRHHQGKSAPKEEPQEMPPAANEADARAEADKSLSTKAYDKALRELHVELVKIQQWVQHAGLKVCVVLEGRDGAGKGGTIKAITERVSPRVFRVVALPAPSDREKSQMYIQRYVPHFPAAGEVVIFDRSYYNRAGIEWVLGFCTEDQHRRFLELCPAFEKNMVENGIKLIKYWLEVNDEEQEVRF